MSDYYADTPWGKNVRIGPAAPSGSACACSRAAVLQCQCGATFCLKCWWGHSHTSKPVATKGGAK